MYDSVTPWTVARQASLSIEFSRQEYWVDCHFLLQCWQIIVACKDVWCGWGEAAPAPHSLGVRKASLWARSAPKKTFSEHTFCSKGIPLFSLFYRFDDVPLRPSPHRVSEHLELPLETAADARALSRDRTLAPLGSDSRACPGAQLRQSLPPLDPWELVSSIQHAK